MANGSVATGTPKATPAATGTPKSKSEFNFEEETPATPKAESVAAKTPEPEPAAEPEVCDIYHFWLSKFDGEL